MADLETSPIRPFPGFPDRMELIPVPGAIFGTLLREIDDLAELKTLLHVLRLLHAQPKAPRFVRRASLLADAGLIEALGVANDAATSGDVGAVSVALDRAEARGTLLAVAVTDGASEDVCYLLNTPANERVVRQVLEGARRLGDLGPAPSPHEPARLAERPSIYELYEQNVGLLTPLLAEELAEAAATFPGAWIEDAFREAVAQNKRNWRYVRRILESWASQGRGTGGATWRRPEAPQTSGDYFETRYGRLIPR